MPFFGNLSTIEWLIIGAVVILLFGGAKLKDLARGLGESGKELKKVRKEFKAAVEDDMDDSIIEKPVRSRVKKG